MSSDPDPTAVAQALVDALVDVRHCGDYGQLWLHPEARVIHITMGDADGDTEEGYTDFDEIVRLCTEAVAPYWPGWQPQGNTFDRNSNMRIADEWSPAYEHDDGWHEVAVIGYTPDEREELPNQVAALRAALGSCDECWAWSVSDDQRLVAAGKRLDEITREIKAVLADVLPILDEPLPVRVAPRVSLGATAVSSPASAQGGAPASSVGQALTSALANVRHCGDYGELWLNESEQRIHLTMGDADGDTESGLTGFDEIVLLCTGAVASYWPGWQPQGNTFDIDSNMRIADEWSPDEDEDEGWVLVGTVGQEHDFA